MNTVPVFPNVLQSAPQVGLSWLTAHCSTASKQESSGGPNSHLTCLVAFHACLSQSSQLSSAPFWSIARFGLQDTASLTSLSMTVNLSGSVLLDLRNRAHQSRYMCLLPHGMTHFALEEDCPGSPNYVL